MTDRELLELAAKAAKIELFDDVQGETCRVYYTDPNKGLKRYTRWNPLTDDGDALRLAVNLGIHITNSSTVAWATTHDVTVTHPIESDPYAATRLAIVRAAAEIGKGME